MDYFNLSASVIIVAIVIFIVFLAFHTELLKPKDYKTPCEELCSEFNYTILRIEDTSTYGYIRYNCWCIKDNEPIDLGRIP